MGFSYAGPTSLISVTGLAHVGLGVPPPLQLRSDQTAPFLEATRCNFVYDNKGSLTSVGCLARHFLTTTVLSIKACYHLHFVIRGAEAPSVVPPLE